jgi:hypothetical protein
MKFLILIAVLSLSGCASFGKGMVEALLEKQDTVDMETV